ncbi:MAG: protein TolR [Alphaproteobacteria bacterium]
MAGGLVRSGRGKRGRRGHSAMADINVTPMVDVMLVLLIVFMVAAPMLTVGVPVDLPQTKGQALNQPDDKPLEISINAKGEIYLQETKVSFDGLVPKLQQISLNNKDARVYIRGDRGLAYGEMMKIMGNITNAGFTKVALVASPPSSGE